MITPDLTEPFDSDDFFKELGRRSDDVLRRHSELPNHRKEFPWLTGCLGDPTADVWFIAENPSLHRAKDAPANATRETQWTISEGDHLFRKMLVKHGFKGGTEYSVDDWGCYITDVVKSAYVVKEWNAKSLAECNRVAEWWAPVLAWELRLGKPKLVVAVGRRAERLLRHVTKHLFEDVTYQAPLSPPEPEEVEHYVSIMSFPQGGLPAGDPDRKRAWDERFAEIQRAAADLGCRVGNAVRL